MNNYSFNELCKLLKNNNINDAADLYNFVYEWDISHDSYILTLLDYYKDSYLNIQRSYYRHVIYECEKYKVVLIYWCPYSFSRIHFHPSNGCIMKVIEGYIDIDIFDDSDYSILQNIGTKLKIEGDIEYIKGRHGIHRISNDKNPNFAITLHIYVN
jgi:cysteine dioxygenase